MHHDDFECRKCACRARGSDRTTALILALCAFNFLFLLSVASFAYVRFQTLDATQLVARGLEIAVTHKGLRQAAGAIVQPIAHFLSPIPFDAPQLADFIVHTNFSTLFNTLGSSVEVVATALNGTTYGAGAARSVWDVSQMLELAATIPYLPQGAPYQPNSLLGSLIVGALNGSAFPTSFGSTEHGARAFNSCVELSLAVQAVNWSFPNYNSSKTNDFNGPVCKVSNSIYDFCSAALVKTGGTPRTPSSTAICQQCKYKWWHSSCAKCVGGGCQWCVPSGGSSAHCTGAGDTSCVGSLTAACPA